MATVKYYNNTTNQWEYLSSGSGSDVGDVIGPESSTDNAIVRFDSTTGKLIQDSSVTIADDGYIRTESSIAGGWLSAKNYINSDVIEEYNTGAGVTVDGVLIKDGLVDGIDIAAADSANVKLTGNETIDGVKTFSSSPVVPTPTTSTQAATKGYVDNATSASMGVVNHGSTASTARPSGYSQVIWIGSVQPTNAIEGDAWWNNG